LRSEGFGDGEEIVVLDTGLNVASKHRIDFIATDAALYLWNGETLQFRVPYGAIADVDSVSDSSGARRAPLHGVSVPPGLPNYFGFVILGVKDPAGLDALVGYTDVSLSNGRLQEYVSVKARFRTISPPYHVSWDASGKGVTFGVLIEEGVPRISAWVADPGVDEKDPSVRSTIDQEMGELQVALGLQPGFGYQRPRPEWMPPRSVWNPPLLSPFDWMKPVPKQRRRRFYDSAGSERRTEFPAPTGLSGWAPSALVHETVEHAGRDPLVTAGPQRGVRDPPAHQLLGVYPIAPGGPHTRFPAFAPDGGGV
jgi:hypothetical protein